VIVGPGAIVLDEVTRYDSEVGLPLAVPIVIEYFTQRRIRDGATQIAPGISKQMRIGKVQYPQTVGSTIDRPKPRA
jgi:hypothetical protein